MSGRKEGCQVVLIREGHIITRYPIDLPAGMLVEQINSGGRHFRRFGQGKRLSAWETGGSVYVQVGEGQSLPVSFSPDIDKQSRVSIPCGSEGLTVRQHEVLDGLIRGQTLAEIAFHLGIRLRSVRHHIDALKHKFDAVSLSQITAKAFTTGWMSSTPPQGGPGAGQRSDHPKKH